MAGRLRESISRKLTLMTTLTSVVSLTLTCAVLIGYQYVTATNHLWTRAGALGDVLSFNTAAAVGFGDRNEATTLLRALDADPGVTAGAIFDATGGLFANYRRANRDITLSLPKGSAERTQGHLVVSRPVTLDGEVLGTLVIWANLDQVYAQWKEYSLLLAFVIVGSALVAYLVASKLQARISRPILDLARHAERVSVERDYSLRVVRATDDEIGRLFQRFNDMLEQIEQRDQALIRAKADLEDRVRQRTSELEQEVEEHRQTETALVRAKEAAETANRAKSAFLANMSHELRTPLNAIIGYSELISEEAEDRGAHDFLPDLAKIRGAGKHLLDLVSDVLDLSKIEAGRLTLQREPLTLETLLADVTATARPLVEKNHNAFDVGPWSGLGTMVGDTVRVRQVLLNLLSNAAKFTHFGTVTLTATRRVGPAGDVIAFAVQDTGIGISAEHLSRLFKHFSQADESTTRRFGGTGLGLAISRQLCRMMGGDIAVVSEPDHGSVFTVTLPVNPDVARSNVASSSLTSRDANPVAL